MKIHPELIQLFRDLEIDGVEVTRTFLEELTKILKNRVTQFCVDFSKDIKLFLIDLRYGKFEELRNIDENKRERIDYNKLYRYEYRKFSNLRCLMVLEQDKKCIFLVSFEEDKGKKKGPNSYNTNIEAAVEYYYNRRRELENEE